MKFNRDREYLVIENQKLIHHVLKHMGISQKHPEYEDLFSIGNIGLMNAATTFDEKKAKKFSTYACVCIRNAVRMYFRESGNRNYPDISINDILPGTENMTLEETIEDTKINIESNIVDKDRLMRSVNYVLNCFPWRQRLAILYYMGEMSVTEIAQRLNCSKQAASKLIWIVRKKFDGLTEEKKRYKEVFHMSMQGDCYHFTFLSKDIKHFHQIFATFLAKVTSIKDIPNFEVLCNQERIIIKVQAHPQAFSFIASIIQEIDEFGLKFVCSSNTSKEIRVSEIPEENEAIEAPEKIEVIETPEEVETVNHQSVRKYSSKTEAIRDYFLNLNCFTVNDLKKQFPNVNDGDIRNAIYGAKQKGLVISKQRGIYEVIATHKN